MSYTQLLKVFLILVTTALLSLSARAQKQDLLSAGWAKADQKMMQANLRKAESYLNYKWPYIPATGTSFRR